MKHPIVIATALALAACVAGPSPTAWFGVAPPPGLQDPPQLTRIPAAPPAVVPLDDPREPAFDGPRIRRDLMTVMGFADRMERTSQFWGRIAGYPSQTETAEWFASQLRAAGVRDVEVQTIEATGQFWRPNSWEIRILGEPAFGAGSRDVVLHSAMPTRGSSIPTPLTAPLIYVGEAGDPVTADVRGKIAIQHVRPAAGAYSERSKISSSARALNAAGAAAVFNWIEQAGNMHVFDFGGAGNAFNLGGADGAFLKAVLERAGGQPVQARLSLDSEMVAGLQAHNVIGVIPGDSAEAIVVNAHLDSWFDGAGDNADGVAVALALARHYGRPENRPARTLIFVGSAGHHSSGMNGPRNVVSANRERLDRAILVLNLEHVAQYQLRTDPWRVDPTEEPKSMGVSNMAPMLVETIREGAARYGYTYDTIEAGVPGDLGGYAPLGVARVQGIHSGPLYHTSGDVAASISTPGLERAARFYRYFIDAVAAAPAAQVNPPQP